MVEAVLDKPLTANHAWGKRKIILIFAEIALCVCQVSLSALIPIQIQTAFAVFVFDGT